MWNPFARVSATLYLTSLGTSVVADIVPLDNGPAIVCSIQRIFGATPMASATHPGPHRHKAPTAGLSRCSTQRADRELCAFISGLPAFVGGVPLTRAMIPWPM